jgi:hypothetical protein
VAGPGTALVEIAGLVVRLIIEAAKSIAFARDSLHCREEFIF